MTEVPPGRFAKVSHEPRLECVGVSSSEGTVPQYPAPIRSAWIKFPSSPSSICTGRRSSSQICSARGVTSADEHGMAPLPRRTCARQRALAASYPAAADEFTPGNVDGEAGGAGA